MRGIRAPMLVKQGYNLVEKVLGALQMRSKRNQDQPAGSKAQPCLHPETHQLEALSPSLPCPGCAGIMPMGGAGAAMWPLFRAGHPERGWNHIFEPASEPNYSSQLNVRCLGRLQGVNGEIIGENGAGKEGKKPNLK